MSQTVSIQARKASILKHHGGDGEVARERITQNFEQHHDDAFWDFGTSRLRLIIKRVMRLSIWAQALGSLCRRARSATPDASVIGIEVAPHMLADPLELPRNGRIIVDDLNEPSADIAPTQRQW